ncbi:unnamed protein product [Nesidiocoris tenuis]|uniref:Ubiquitin-conjugating enzyme n=2 Tax=Nesidiocoris tenuis TaxID=355587 RepID=A0ABN7AII4_9HEMI|nr:ubiquitin-conjugating enzyme [Nesidiocoris tenuis]CAB0014887.1 unnamed protein product [Nesidiocoris tenuis]
MSEKLPKASAIKALSVEYTGLVQEPLEGFQVKLAREENMFEWDIVIFGPPETLYQGGYFKAKMRFPQDYPFSPPTLKFTTKLWHPNIYDNGDVCISILHPPVDDPPSGELPCERWNPTQTVRTILLSVVSLLNEPNTFSPANVDASVMYRRWKESQGANKEYEEIIKRQVAMSREQAAKDGVDVPQTLEDYTRASRIQRERGQSQAESSDFYEDLIGDDDDDTDMETSVTNATSDNS